MKKPDRKTTLALMGMALAGISLQTNANAQSYTSAPGFSKNAQGMGYSAAQVETLQAIAAATGQQAAESKPAVLAALAALRGGTTLRYPLKTGGEVTINMTQDRKNFAVQTAGNYCGQVRQKLSQTPGLPPLKFSQSGNGCTLETTIN